ncbi:RsiV family protein [Olivibacter sp. CPCC 100613]|uniref:RsiV family protein n=1 Tax=Olivibacter sp. CPCC 100613 TaxID=3079931 RepID=UPI002FFD30D1
MFNTRKSFGINTSLPFFFAFFLLTSCNQPNEQRSVTKSDTLRYVYQHYALSSKEVVENDGKKDTTYFKADFPVFEQKEIDALIKKQFTANRQPDTQYTSIEQEAKAFIENYEDFVKMDEYPRAWYAEMHAKVLENKASYLSLSLELSDYTGGAHGNYATLFYNYDPSKVDTIGLEKVINSDRFETLTKIAEGIFREQEGLSSAQSLDESYFFEDNRFHLNNNFTLTPKGLLFLYNVYEIKPYAAGVTKLMIPYEQIDSLMSEEGKRIRTQLVQDITTN